MLRAAPVLASIRGNLGHVGQPESPVDACRHAATKSGPPVVASMRFVLHPPSRSVHVSTSPPDRWSGEAMKWDEDYRIEPVFLTEWEVALAGKVDRVMLFGAKCDLSRAKSARLFGILPKRRRRSSWFVMYEIVHIHEGSERLHILVQ